MGVTHTIIHQFNPEAPFLGGIEGYLAGCIEYAPETADFLVVGVVAPGTEPRLGQRRMVTVRGRSVDFIPVARLDAANQRGALPHALRLAGGLLRYRPTPPEGILHCHKVETAAVVDRLYPRREIWLFIHNDSRRIAQQGIETAWRFAPGVHDRLERWVSRRAARTVVIDPTARQRLSEARPDVEQGSNWYDPRWFHLRNPTRGGLLTIGWVGRFEPSKDPLRAVEVFKRLRERGVRFAAWMAGAGTLSARVAAALEAESLSQVELLGVLSADELGRRLNDTSALLVTSRWEGFPRSVLEALACGTPFVTTPSWEVSSLLDDPAAGSVSASADPDELASLIQQVAEQHDPAEVASSVSSLDGPTVVGHLFGGRSARTTREENDTEATNG